MLTRVIIVFSFLFCTSLGYKILLFPLPASSHVYSFYYISQELMKRGHEVHFLIHWGFEMPDKWTKATDGSKGLIIHKYGNHSGFEFKVEEEALKLNMNLMHNNYDNSYAMEEMKRISNLSSTDFFQGNDRVFDHLDGLMLDAAVVDYTFFMRFPVAIAKRLRLPLVSYVDILEPWLVRTPWFPSIYAPLLPTDSVSSSFFQRLFSTFLLAKAELFPPFPDADKKLLNTFWKHESSLCLQDIIRDSVLFLVPEDPVLCPVRPYTANVIGVGGLTTESLKLSDSLALPDEYSKFLGEGNVLENAGTVVVSFGSLVPKYPERLARTFLEAFARLPQYRFVWRFNNHLALDIPKNVKIARWLPQNQLLGHPSVKLFITHSGNNGQFEAIYHGVPMLAVPLLGDQPKNAKRMVDRGYGEELDFRTLSVEELVTSIEKVISDPLYKARIMKGSMIFKSRPDTPAERAAFWIEHVIRFGGDHLKPIGNDLTFWQYLCLDVLLFIEFVIISLIVLSVFVVRKLIQKLCSGRDKSSEKKRMQKQKKRN